LIPYANNPRLHSEADLDKLAASMGKWGWTNPVLVDEQGVLIAGNGRVAAAGTRLELKFVPVIVARGWSEEEKQAYRLLRDAVDEVQTGRMNRMLHLGVPPAETIGPKDWGAVLRLPEAEQAEVPMLERPMMAGFCS
jgi:hypothetical protein